MKNAPFHSQHLFLANIAHAKWCLQRWLIMNTMPNTPGVLSLELRTPEKMTRGCATRWLRGNAAFNLLQYQTILWGTPLAKAIIQQSSLTHVHKSRSHSREKQKKALNNDKKYWFYYPKSRQILLVMVVYTRSIATCTVLAKSLGHS